MKKREIIRARRCGECEFCKKIGFIFKFSKCFEEKSSRYNQIVENDYWCDIYKEKGEI